MRRTDGDCRGLQVIRHVGQKPVNGFCPCFISQRGWGDEAARLLCAVIGWKGGGYEFSFGQ